MSYSKFYGSLIWIVFLFFSLLSCEDSKSKTRATVPSSQTQTTVKSLNCANGSLRVSKKRGAAGPSINTIHSSTNTIQLGEAVSINGNSTGRVPNLCLNNSGFSFHCEGMAQKESSFICHSGYITLTNPGAPTPTYSQTPYSPPLQRHSTNRINIYNAQINTWGDYKKFSVSLTFSHYAVPQATCKFTYGCGY